MKFQIIDNLCYDRLELCRQDLMFLFDVNVDTKGT